MKRREFFKKSALGLAALPVLGSVKKKPEVKIHPATDFTLTSTPPKLVEPVSFRYCLYDKIPVKWISLNSIIHFEKNEPRWTIGKEPKLYWEFDIEVADIRNEEMTKFLTACEENEVILSVNYGHEIELIVDGFIVMCPYPEGIIAYADIEPFYIYLGYTQIENIILRRHHANSQM